MSSLINTQIEDEQGREIPPYDFEYGGLRRRVYMSRYWELSEEERLSEAIRMFSKVEEILNDITRDVQPR